MKHFDLSHHCWTQVHRATCTISKCIVTFKTFLNVKAKRMFILKASIEMYLQSYIYDEFYINMKIYLDRRDFYPCNGVLHIITVFQNVTNII